MTDARRTGLFARLPDLPIAAASIGGFWLFYFGTVVVRAALVDHDLNNMGQRAFACLVGVLLTFLVWLVLRRAAAESLKIKVIAAAINFCTVLFVSRPLFSLPFKSLAEVKETRSLLLIVNGHEVLK